MERAICAQPPAWSRAGGKGHRRLPAMLCAALAAGTVLFGSSAAAQKPADRPKAGERATAGPRQPDFDSAIQHIVFIIKENRSFDGYFGTFPGAFGATSGPISTGQVIPLFHAGDRYPRDFNHSWLGLVQAIDFGRMDDFDLPTQFPCSVNGDYLCYSQNYQEDLPNYWQYAQQYALADEMFSSEPGPSYPQHLFAVAASSAGVIGEGTVPPGENPACDSPSGSTVTVLDLIGNLTDQYPCFNVPTMADSLDAAGIPWKSYTDVESVWNGFLSISHIRHSSDWNTDIVKQTQFLGDVASSQLPPVSWLVPDNPDSEHPPSSICKGENWTVEQINAIMNSPYWNNVAIFVTWDDPDGVYDHVAPPVLDEYGLGPRVPMLIISPYVKGGYVSHTVYETSSVLKFIEERFNLPFLTERDAGANDILDSFDFTQAPLPPLTLPTRACPVNSQSLVSFPSQQVGIPSPVRSILLTNFNSTTLTINSIKTTGDFSQSNHCKGSIAPDPADPPDCAVSVTFTPTAAGTRTGTLTITDSDPSSPQVVQLSGTGTNVVLSPALLNFGTAVVGSATAPESAVLANDGAAAVTINSISGTPDYQVSSACGSSVPAHSQCALSAVFTPTTPGKRYGALTVTTSDAGSPQVVNMSGIGTEVTLEPSTLQFSSQAIGTASASQNVTLTNLGSTPLEIGTINFVGNTGSQPGEATTDFSQTNNCGSAVGAGGACTIAVDFDPTGLGARSAVMNITDNYADSPQQVVLSGTGVASANNPVPFVSELSPTTVPPGSGSTQLAVTGTGFVSGSVVNWNHTTLATTYNSGHSLTATIPASLLVKAKTAQVAVVNPQPGGGTSGVGFVTVAKAEQQVAFLRTDVPVGGSPAAVVAGDFNGDGIEDVAVANSASNTLSILLGTGKGQFTLASSPATGRDPVSLAAGDFNSDGKLDLAVGNLQDNTVAVLLGNGDGTFKPAASACSTVYPVSIAAGDFNNDGDLDVAVANGLEPEVSILLGSGTGSLAPASTPLGEGTDPQSVVLGGFNADGNLDLAEVNSVDLTLVALLGNGDGTFKVSSPNPPSTGLVPLATATGDFNGDGILDVAVANQGDNTVSVFLGNGDGTFTAPSAVKVGKGPVALAVADVDGHGPLDLVTANQQANTITILRGNGAGGFKNRVDYAVGALPTGVAVADWNADGRLDVVTSNSGAGTISILQQTALSQPAAQAPGVSQDSGSTAGDAARRVAAGAPEAPAPRQR